MGQVALFLLSLPGHSAHVIPALINMRGTDTETCGFSSRKPKRRDVRQRKVKTYKISAS